ncbi:hypothetical protein POM88_001850 [Heracleum sosnowskyi]|uniref:Uncharacterized protein n=1 Tax=Heracleum sosnowskyi TaxID=360622 RepID=A0AAD8JD11_9APIA|nr:hypothetical protein POM88_001850 [Heracleum sosnowskyi]
MDSVKRATLKIHTSGDVCVGDLKGSEGKLILPSGAIYDGYFKEGLRHGNGKCTWPSGTSYEGDWDERKTIGKGKCVWPSGKSYEGDWDKGNGLEEENADGSVYRGSWKLDNRHGIGEQKYQNSDVYEAGERCGRGVYKGLTGELFDGFWLNGLTNGPGFYRFKGGNCFFGTFTDGKLVKLDKLYLATGIE